MLSFQWPVITDSLEDGRHELVLSGPEVAELLSSCGFDERIYRLEKLNFLEISHTPLDELSDGIGNIKNLAQLCLTSNKLCSVPAGLGKLQFLRFLDLSFNQITELPDDIFKHLTRLTSLNVSGNELVRLPSMGYLTDLHDLLVSKNKLEVSIFWYLCVICVMM